MLGCMCGLAGSISLATSLLAEPRTPEPLLAAACMIAALWFVAGMIASVR